MYCNSSCVRDKLKSAAVVRSSQNLRQTTLVAFLGKRFRALAYQHSRKQQRRVFPQPASKSFWLKPTEKATSRGGVEDTRLEAKAKDTKKIRGQGQGQPFRGQNLSKPRTGMLEAKAKDQGHRRKCSPKKKKSSKIFFRRSPIRWRTQNLLG